MKNVFIIGARGYRANYGGWETFVTNLVDAYDSKDTVFYVSELTDDCNRDKTKEKVRNHFYLCPIYVKQSGSSKMFFYTMKSYLQVLKFIKSEKMQHCYIYVLGLKLGPLLWFYKRLRKKYQIQVFVNPDGLEHQRSKWNKVIQMCFLLSEWSMIQHCDLVVCDALGIEDYIQKKYKKAKNKTIYIPYGAKKEDLTKIDELKVLEEFHLKKNQYCLMVGRCVPENNYELVLQDFMKSNIQKDLVIITNLSSSTYYQELVMKTKCNMDSRIRFIDGVYDSKKLAVIRKNAYLYIHGHSVGGTNPSLLEALSMTDLNLLYDVCFNRDIGQDACFYFKESGSLTLLLDDSKKLDCNRRKMGKMAKDLIDKYYTWENIVEQYKRIFK